MPTFHRPYKVVVVQSGPPTGVIAAFVAAAAMVVVGLIVFIGWFAWVFFLLEGLAVAGMVTLIVVVNRRELRAVPRLTPPRLESHYHAEVLPASPRRELPATVPRDVVIWPSRRDSGRPQSRS